MKNLYKEVYSVMNQGVILNQLILDKNEEAEDCIILEVNQSQADILGKSKNEIAGRKMSEVFPHLNHEWIKRIGEITKRGDSKRFEKYNVEIDQYFDIDVLPAGVNQFLLLTTDVTEKKLKERQMSSLIEELTASQEELRSNYIELKKAKDKMDEAENLKNQFLANINHEIKTPLNGICAFSKLLSQTKMDQEQQEYLEMIEESSRHLMDLLDKLLSDTETVSKLEKGKLELNYKRFKVKDALQRILKEFLFICEFRNLKFNYSIDNHIPLTVVGDEIALNQVLAELFNNLLKYTNEGEISLKIKKIFQMNEKISLQFEVMDTGINFKNGYDELSNKIIHQTSQELIKMMNGQVWIEENGDDSGSSIFFTAEFLIDTAELPDISEMELSVQNNAENKMILIVEENRINMKILMELLKKMGCRIISAKNGQEGIELFIKHKPELVLLDVNMSKQDGYETAGVIRKIEKSMGINVPIIGTLSSDMPGTRELCENAGMEDYILKPFEINKLERVIKNYL